jgi:hypothetical protein
MAIQKEFVLRYRGEGHVRFKIPQVVTQEHAARQICDQLLAIDGVTAVRLFRRSEKLAIHYHETALGFKELAKKLFDLLDVLEQQGCFVTQVLVPVPQKKRLSLKQKLKASRINRWLDEKMLAAKETAQAARVIGKISTKGPKALINNPEKAIIDFLNDILVLYLIKVHWTRITQQWLVKPIVHRYEWMATFYLFFLLVRSRKK